MSKPRAGEPTQILLVENLTKPVGRDGFVRVIEATEGFWFTMLKQPCAGPRRE